LYSIVLYGSLTACGADSGSGVAPVTIPVTVKEVPSETNTEAKVEAKAEDKAEAKTVQTTTSTSTMSENAPAPTAPAQEPTAEAPAENAVAMKLTSTSCVDPELNEVKAGVQIMLCNGTLATGTLVIPAAPDLSNLTEGNVRSGVTIAGVTGTLDSTRPADCSGNAQVGCVTTATYKSANLTNLSNTNIRFGVTIAGVTGTVSEETHSSCTGENQLLCITTPTWRSVNYVALSAANIKSGVTIAGVTGTLTPETHTECTFNGQTGCVSSETYKAIDATNLLAANIKNGVSVGGVTGTYPSASAPLASATATADLTAATFNLKIKSDAQFEYFDSTGARHTQTGNSALSEENIRADVTLFNVSGTLEPAAPIALNSWDLREGVSVSGVTGKLKTHCRTFDMNGGAAVPANEKCLASEIWEDLTPTVASGLDCAASPNKCLFKNKVTGLTFTRGFPAESKSNAVILCDGLTYGGYDDWRLPSTEEAIQASTMGATSRGFLPTSAHHWSTNVYTGLHYTVIMSNAVATSTTAGTYYPYFCVRK
jgi:hypothetical protein